MNIEAIAVKLGLKGGKNLLKRAAEPVRRWATRWAWRGREKRVKDAGTYRVPLIALVAVSLASGCASFKAAIQDTLIVADEKAFGGGQNPGIGRVPDGHIVVKFPRDSQGNRVYMDGWTWDWEMVKKEGYVAPPFTLQDAKAKTDLQLIMDMLSDKAESGDSGAADAQKLMMEAAKEAGVK